MATSLPALPDGPWIDRGRLAEQHARAAQAQGRHREALEALKRVPRRRAADAAARALAEAEALLGLHRCREAAGLAARALRRPGLAADQEARLRLARAQALWRSGRIPAARGEALRAARLAVADATRPPVAEALALVAWAEGRIDEAARRLHEARAAYAGLGDLGGLARVAGTQAALQRTSGRPRAALALATRRLAIARATTRLDLLALAHQQRALLQMHLGDWRAARLDAERAVELFRGLGDPRAITLAGVTLARLDTAAGRAAGARAALEQARATLSEAGDEPAARAEIDLALADVRLIEGDAAGALDEAGRALRGFVQARRRGGQCRARLRLAHALFTLGRTGEALRAARRASVLAARCSRQVRAMAALALGRVLVALDPSAAREAFLRGQAWAGAHAPLAHLARLGGALVACRLASSQSGQAPALEVAQAALREWGDARLLALARQALGVSRAGTDAAPAVPAPRADEHEGDDGPAFPGILGRCAPMRALFRAMRRVAAADVAVFVLGETGTGKERVARALHDASRRRGRAFVAVNASSLSDELFEAELFGHARGAFTGAVAAREGLLAQADGGTLFLDEVADLSPRAQAKLLRFLQEGEYRRVGENELRRADVRVVSAANRDLDACVAAGAFREDLLYRLNTVVLRLPPLRERGEDLLLLARHFAAGAARRAGRPVAALGADLARRLLAHRWPGNVRQLENELQRLVALAGDGPLRVEDLSPRVAASPETAPPAADGPSLRVAQLEWERAFVARALERNGGRRLSTAAALGITRQALLLKLQRLGLE